MIALLIEVSTERGCVALFKNKDLIYHAALNSAVQNSKNLFPEIIKAFSAAALTPEDVKLLIVGIGPGSYTGIRVGAVTAKALSLSLNIPLVGVCSLEAFIPNADGPFASIIDAKIGGVYCQTGVVAEGIVKNLSKPSLYSIEEAVSYLNEISILVTPNSSSLRPKFELLTDHLWEWIETDPNPLQMAKSAFAKFESGGFTMNQDLDLLYLRKTQAEIEKEKKSDSSHFWHP